jgi:hypothetical protein
MFSCFLQSKLNNTFYTLELPNTENRLHLGTHSCSHLIEIVLSPWVEFFSLNLKQQKGVRQIPKLINLSFFFHRMIHNRVCKIYLGNWFWKLMNMLEYLFVNFHQKAAKCKRRKVCNLRVKWSQLLFYILSS